MIIWNMILIITKLIFNRNSRENEFKNLLRIDAPGHVLSLQLKVNVVQQPWRSFNLVRKRRRRPSVEIIKTWKWMRKRQFKHLTRHEARVEPYSLSLTIMILPRFTADPFNTTFDDQTKCNKNVQHFFQYFSFRDRHNDHQRAAIRKTTKQTKINSRKNREQNQNSHGNFPVSHLKINGLNIIFSGLWFWFFFYDFWLFVGYFRAMNQHNL